MLVVTDHVAHNSLPDHSINDKKWSSRWNISIGQLKHIAVLTLPTYQPHRLYGVS